MDKKDILPSDEELDKLENADGLNSKEILEDLKKKEGKNGEEEKSKPLSEEDFADDDDENAGDDENVEPDIDTESDDKKKGLLLDIRDDDEASKKGEKSEKRDYSREMAVALVVASFFAIVVLLIKIFNYSSVLNLFLTTLMFFSIWFVMVMFTFFLMHSNFPKIYEFFFKMDEKLKGASASEEGASGAEDSGDDDFFESDTSDLPKEGPDAFEPSDDKGVFGDSVDNKDFDLKNVEKLLASSSNTQESTKVDDFDFSFDNKDVARAVRSMISDDGADQDKK